MNKIKVIATLNKLIVNDDIVKMMIESGVSAFYIKEDYQHCEEIIKIINKMNRLLNEHVAIILNVEGPTTRVGKILNKTAYLKKSDKIRIYRDDILGDCTKFSVDWKNFVDDVPINSKLIIDNIIELKILEKNNDYLLCLVLTDGTIKENSILNTSNIRLNNSYLTDNDFEIINFALKNNIDYLLCENVTHYEDILEVNDLLIKNNNEHIQIISKIDNIFAIDNINEIIKVSNCVIIDRKNLGTTFPLEKIPSIQKQIISKCHDKGVACIISSDLLFNVNNFNYLNRADIFDIANAILEGIDCVLLTDETMSQSNIGEVLDMLKKIIETTENDINYEYMLQKSINSEKRDMTGSLAYSVAGCALRLKCKAIVTPTISGYTAKKISRFKPICPIIAPTPNESTVKSLALNFGVIPILIDDMKSLDAIIEKSTKIAKEIMELKEKDNIIITGGYPFKKTKHTNFMKIEEI